MEVYLGRHFRSALDRLGAPNDTRVEFEIPQNASHGDLSTNVAMTLAKPLKKSPRQIAQEIIGHLDLDSGYVRSIDIAGPGFINVTFSKTYLIDQLRALLDEGARFGRTRTNEGKAINLEWVSANPTGRLHAGHGRQVCLGQAIANLLEWTGGNLTREYYFNNAGNQMANLAKSVRVRYLQQLGEQIELNDDGYRGEEIVDIAKQMVAEFGESKRGAPLSVFQSYGEQANFGSIRSTLDRLGVHHDVFFNENSLYDSGAVESTIREFKEHNLAYEKDGALWLKLSEMGEKEDRVIVKSSGEPTYRLPDICYHRNKLGRGYDQIIDIFGADHIATIADVLAALRALGYDTARIKVIIHQMVSFVSGGELIMFSKRSGGAYTLDELIEDVGADAAKFFFNMRSAGSHLEFDVELAKEQSEKNPVYYVQYAHARIASILRFAEQQGLDISQVERADLTILDHVEEHALIKVLLRFPTVLDRSAVSLAPHHVCEYLREVAQQFHKFYHDCRIVGSAPELQSARLALTLAAKRVLAGGCAVLDVTAPESM
ncbi:MAG: arginine--tRNA ligase [Bacteroidota bacterium]|nr:arginine--tRNA ligase [Bacteroidota bacterium]MDP4234460.1 arginine--tRNA ligase [Bacteroidota bacterium]MDP4243958.1 arginine--tRNA ligase [Bacteroidota bacterium]MDP4288192.1 arginine--tRNA ligase [Bacteroidota bacterium]